jgi:CBS domain-containing protein
MTTLVDFAQTPAPSVTADTTVWKAVETLRKSRSGALAVTDGVRLAGVLSERDLVHRVVGEGRDPRKTLVRDVMTSDPVTAAMDTSAENAFDEMMSRRVRHLVVVDAENRPVGLASLRQIAEARVAKGAETIRILSDYTNDSLGG